jgi:HEAT repeat protein
MAGDADTVAVLIQSLGHADKKIIRRSVDALVELAHGAPELRDEVAAAMARAPADKRWPMAYVLAQVAPLDDACFAALKDGLDRSDPDIRWAIIVLLARLAKQPGSNIAERLIALAKSGTATQRRMAVYALRDVGAQTPESQQAVRAALGDADALVRVAALTSLKLFPEAALSACAEILSMLENDADARVRATAALALAQSGTGNEEMTAALQRAASSSDPIVAKSAQAAVDRLAKKAP